MPHPGQAARQAALDLMTKVTDEGRLLSELLPKSVAYLEPAERARAGRLASEALRWASRADRVLGPYLRQRPDGRTHNMLRLGVWELCADGAAAHGVVNSAVEILKARPETVRQAGLVNAILRKVADNMPDWDALPEPVLPKWLRKPLLADYGKAAIAGMERAHAAGAPMDLTPGPRASADLAQQLCAEVLPGGSLRLEKSGQVTALPGYEEGWWWVQDVAAALPARILNSVAGETVIDLCAAPGGKTMQLAASGARVTALDVSEARMERVSENLARTGLTAQTLVADALDWLPPELFDAVLLDAPCSATGTIRRHPDLPYAKDGSGFPELFELQSALLDRAIGMLKPGGRLVYCTCSLLIDEGEEQVRDALQRHPALIVDLEALGIEGVDADWIGPEGLRTRPDFWPDKGGMDGFFIAMLRKPAEGIA